jgi:transposase
VRKTLCAGVDACKATSQITIMDETGKVLRRRRVASSPAGIREALAHCHGPPKAVLAASCSWGPTYDWLAEIADEVAPAHPAQVPAITAGRIKTDRIDPETLAHLLRAGLILAAYAPSEKVRAAKRVPRHRMFLVRARAMVKNRIRALPSQHAVALPELGDPYGKTGLRWLGQVHLPDLDGRLPRDDIKVLVQITGGIASTDHLIDELANGDDAVKWLASLPGIGTFLSVLIRYEVDDIQRFREPKKFAGCPGVVPSIYASGP